MKMIASASLSARNQRTCVLLTALAGVLLLGTALQLAGCGDDKASVTFPQPPEPLPMNWLFDVFGTGPDDIYACGNKGAMFHFDGDSWSRLDLGVTTPIVTVWGPGDGTLLAAGHAGRIWRNTAGSWNPMVSGTDLNLFGLGSWEGSTYACGEKGALRRLSGSTWSGTGTSMVIRDIATGAATDTLSLIEDIASLVTVNHFFIGGAYILPDWGDEYFGMLGTDGMVCRADTVQDWRLRPLRGDEQAISEWVLCTTSDDVTLANNYLGTSEGWLFRLTEDEAGALVWAKQYPCVTQDPAQGIRDMWLDVAGNLYMVTDDGDLVFQTADYDYLSDAGSRSYHRVMNNSLAGIWGTSPDDLYMVGYVENQLFHAGYDQALDELTVETVTLDFGDKAMTAAQPCDEYGRPLR